MAFNNKELEDCINSSAPIETPSSQPLQLSVDANGNIEDGGRNNTLYKIACHLYFKGLDDEHVRLCISSINNARCKPPLTEAEVSKSIDSARSSWEKSTEIEWPPIQQAITNEEDLPPLQPELIKGLLRKGAYMGVTGASKVGKTTLLINLAIAVANGVEWLSYKCERGKVLYLNLEVQGESFSNKVYKVYSTFEQCEHMQRFDYLNLRGFDIGIQQVQEYLDEKPDYDLFILDPTYKINLGDENSASEQAKFFNYIDHITARNNTGLVLAHHHSKGDQIKRNAQDRGSGSGVLARTVDALLDLLELKNCLPPSAYPNATPLVVSTIARDYPPQEPFGLWHCYPKFIEDETGQIIEAFEGAGGQKKNQKKIDDLVDAVEELQEELGDVRLKDLETKTGKCTNTLKTWLPRAGYEIDHRGKNGTAFIVPIKNDK